MSDPIHQDKFSPVKDIIDREKDEALGYFREMDFESRIKTRMNTDFRSESSVFLFLRKPVLVFSVFILVCCASALIVFLILSPSPHEQSVKIIEEFLLKNTNLQEVLTDDTAQELELKTMTLSIEDELECWQNSDCRKKIFNQIMSVFKEKKDDSQSHNL